MRCLLLSLSLSVFVAGCGTIDDTAHALSEVRSENQRLQALQDERQRQDSEDQRAIAAISAESRELTSGLESVGKSREREASMRQGMFQQNVANVRTAVTVLQTDDLDEQERRLSAVVEGERTLAQMNRGLEQQATATDQQLNDVEKRVARVVDEAQRMELRNPIKDEIARQAREAASNLATSNARATANVNMLSEVAGAFGDVGRLIPGLDTLPGGSLIARELGLRDKPAAATPAAATPADVAGAVRQAFQMESERAAAAAEKAAAERERERQEKQQQQTPQAPQKDGNNDALMWWLVGSNLASGGAGGALGNVLGRRSAGKPQQQPAPQPQQPWQTQQPWPAPQQPQQPWPQPATPPPPPQTQAPPAA